MFCKELENRESKHFSLNIQTVASDFDSNGNQKNVFSNRFAKNPNWLGEDSGWKLNQFILSILTFIFTIHQWKVHT